MDGLPTCGVGRGIAFSFDHPLRRNGPDPVAACPRKRLAGRLVRQAEAEGGALAFHAFGADAAPVTLHDALD